MSRKLLSFCLCAAIVGFAGALSARADVDLSKPLDLKFTAIDGRQVDLSKLRGKVVLVDFWATWCPPCRAVAPDIVTLYKKFHDQGFDVVGVSVDSDKSALLDVIKKEGLVWPQYYDGQGADNAITSKFGVDSFPTLWLVGKDGKVVDADFRQMWIGDYGIEPKTSPETMAKIEARIEKELKTP
jgi:thiol-disulfide isomerase/thioredoxin